MPGPIAHPVLSTVALIGVVVVIAALAALVARSIDAPSWPMFPKPQNSGRHRRTGSPGQYLPRSWDELAAAPISAPPVVAPEPEPVVVTPLDEGWDWRAHADELDRELVAA